jgi:cytochrome c biogenesis protein CcdA
MSFLKFIKKLNRKGMEAPSTLIIMIIFIVGLTIVILLILFFSGKAGEPNSAFSIKTKWSDLFKWL